MTTILQGAPVAKAIYDRIRASVEELGFAPFLQVFIAGADPASDFYVQNIVKRGAKVGITVEVVRFSESVGSQEFADALRVASSNPAVHGIMVQRPLPKHLDETAILAHVHPDKDVDAVTVENMGRLLLEREGFYPCTAESVIEVMRFYGISPAGKEVVVLGRSAVIGKPLANMLLRKGIDGDATVTVCHSRSPHLAEITKCADILVAAIGRAGFVTREMIRPEAVVLDVGVNEVTNPDGTNRYVGDVDYSGVVEIVSAITPVPGGIGTVTTAVLLAHVIDAARMKRV
jgi:methylenetetrahydrofolate dehydrogenase (NADP+)/methenyltetrahydrofolate cyclohydrolase